MPTFIDLTGAIVSGNGAGGVKLEGDVVAIMDNAAIGGNSGNGVTILGDGVNASLKGASLISNERYAINVIPSRDELVSKGFKEDIPDEYIYSALDAIKNVDHSRLEVVIETLKSIGISKYLTATADLTTIATFLLTCIVK